VFAEFKMAAQRLLLRTGTGSYIDATLVPTHYWTKHERKEVRLCRGAPNRAVRCSETSTVEFFYV
jgi:hypothetical protein